MRTILFGRNGKNIIIFGLICIVAGIIFYVVSYMTNREFIITYFKTFSFRADYLSTIAGLFFVLFGWVQYRFARKQDENNS
jgi:uncharacterized membrane protein